MKYLAIYFAFAFFALFALIGLRMVIDGVWHRRWKFALGSLALTLLCGLSAYDRLDCARNDCPSSDEDRSFPRIR